MNQQEKNRQRDRQRDERFLEAKEDTTLLSLSPAQALTAEEEERELKDVNETREQNNRTTA